MSFIPDQYVSEILKQLREEDLEWMSEEIEEVISAGKSETFFVKESRLGGRLNYELGQQVSSDSDNDTSVSSEKTRSKLVAFSLEEQLQIITKSMESYTLGTADLITRIEENIIDLWPSHDEVAIKTNFLYDTSSENQTIQKINKEEINDILED